VNELTGGSRGLKTILDVVRILFNVIKEGREAMTSGNVVVAVEGGCIIWRTDQPLEKHGPAQSCNIFQGGEREFTMRKRCCGDVNPGKTKG